MGRSGCNERSGEQLWDSMLDWMSRSRRSRFAWLMGAVRSFAKGSLERAGRLDHLAQIRRSRPSNGFGGRQEGRDQFPFPIGQVACVAQPFAVIFRASDFSPLVVSPVIASTATESQPIKITQLFSGQTLRRGNRRPGENCERGTP